MSIRFFLNRDGMIAEVNRLIAARDADALESLCNCCMYKKFDMDYECQHCRIRLGIRMLGGRSRRSTSENAVLLGV